MSRAAQSQLAGIRAQLAELHANMATLKQLVGGHALVPCTEPAGGSGLAEDMTMALKEQLHSVCQDMVTLQAAAEHTAQEFTKSEQRGQDRFMVLQMAQNDTRAMVDKAMELSHAVHTDLQEHLQNVANEVLSHAAADGKPSKSGKAPNGKQGTR